jgi:translation initiation factor 3 subunit B
MWSPHGTYLVTLHQNGVFLWGGPEFKLIRKFPHHNVDLIDFSPCEKYIVTFSQRPMEQNPEEVREALCFFFGLALCSLLTWLILVLS